MSTPTAPSIVRTLVPVAVGQIVAYFGTIGLTVPEDVETALTVILGFAVTTVYYLAIRFLEQKFPKLGALLGWAATPGEYAQDHDVIEPEVVDDPDLEQLAADEVDDTPPSEDFRPKH